MKLTSLQFVFTMFSLMSLQIKRSLEAQSTGEAFIWFLSSMYYSMSLQMVESDEALATCAAYMWSLSCMNSLT